MSPKTVTDVHDLNYLLFILAMVHLLDQPLVDDSTLWGIEEATESQAIATIPLHIITQQVPVYTQISSPNRFLLCTHKHHHPTGSCVHKYHHPTVPVYTQISSPYSSCVHTNIITQQVSVYTQTSSPNRFLCIHTKIITQQVPVYIQTSSTNRFLCIHTNIIT